jgi:hypothetical protein
MKQITSTAYINFKVHLKEKTHTYVNNQSTVLVMKIKRGEWSHQGQVRLVVWKLHFDNKSSGTLESVYQIHQKNITQAGSVRILAVTGKHRWNYQKPLLNWVM